MDIFWGDLYDEFLKSEKSERKLERFYGKYRDQFVTEYATSHPVEDFGKPLPTMRSN